MSGIDRDPPFEEDAEELFEHAPCGYLTMDPSGVIVRANATFAGWIGSPRDAIVGRRFMDLLTRGGRIYYETHYAPMLMLQGSVREIAFDIVRADGTLLPVLVNASRDLDPTGAPWMIRAAIFDASHRREYERQLMRARDEERAAREQTARLQQVSGALVATLDPSEIGQAVLRAVTPLATSGQGSLLRIDEGARTADVLAWIGRAPPETRASIDEDDGFAVLRATLDHGDPGPHLLAPADLAGVDAEAWGDGIVIQSCVTDGRVVGALCLGRAPVAPLDEAEIALLAVASQQCALALERARLFEREHSVARTLQGSLLAGAPPVDPRCEIASFYEPGVRDLSVGGDWHDAFACAPGRLALVVGDIVGRGLEAASTMGRLRSAVRALAVAGFSPAELLSRLDAFVMIDEAARMATLVYAEVELESGRTRIACAGHPPALIVRPGEEPQFVWDGRSVPLGALAAPGPRGEESLELGPGAALFLYTDGLIERRSDPIDSGLDRLVRAVSESRHLPLPSLLRRITRDLLADEEAGDDVCALAVRLS